MEQIAHQDKQKLEQREFMEVIREQLNHIMLNQKEERICIMATD